MSHVADPGRTRQAGSVVLGLPPGLPPAGTTAPSTGDPDPTLPPARDEPLCVTCGLTVPPEETECAFCVHARAAEANSAGALLRHWAVFIAVMLVVFGAGWIIAP